MQAGTGLHGVKPSGTPLSGVQWQTNRYAEGVPAEMRLGAVPVEERLPFLFEASGTETVFTNLHEPDSSSRHLFAFPRPETLARVLRDAEANEVARDGVEPSTFRFSVGRSYQLSYLAGH